MATISRMFRKKPITVPDMPHLVGKDQALFLSALEQAARYLEYGAGGSTVAAAKQGVETVCVESDRRFADAVDSKIRPLDHRVALQYVDIGPTGRWGRPLKVFATPKRRRRYPNYVYAPDRYAASGFFDLILIDGRFRIACALYAFRRATEARAPSLICFDDYRLRREYRAVEKYCEPESVGDNMAFFRPARTGLLLLPKEEDILTHCRSAL